MAARSFVFVVLVVEENLQGTESVGGRNGVVGVTLDDVGHCRRVLRIGKVSDGIHPTIGEMVPDSVLKVNKAAGLCKESCRAGTIKVVPLLGRGGMDRAELVWWCDVVGGAWIEADPTRSWLAASPG